MFRDIPSVFDSRVNYYGIISKLKIPGATDFEKSVTLMQNYTNYMKDKRLKFLDKVMMANWFYFQLGSAYVQSKDPSAKLSAAFPGANNVPSVVDFLDKTFDVVLLSGEPMR